jgi:carbon-monoxide dehydrogenase small subunit
MQTFTFQVNGESKTVETEPERSLLDVLREDLDLVGTKYGCGEGTCRSCTVLLDDRPVPSCVTPMSKVEGRKVLTIEGLAEGDRLHPVQEAFIAETAMQCGYCVPAMVLAATALLRSNPQPTREQIVEWMNPHLCRCTNYLNIVRAVERAARAQEAHAK